MSDSETSSVLVTGAPTGIGQAIARGFAESGAQVLGVGIGDMPADEAGLTYQTLDVRDGEAVKSLVGAMKGLKVVVNAAGTLSRGGEHDPETFQQVVDVNLNGTMRVCAAARETLAANKGCIINIASMLSYFGGGLVPAYSASKGGVAQLTKSLAIAYAGEGIRVNALAPGWIATSMTQGIRDNSERDQTILGRTPMARWGRPDELVGPALFLASEAAGFVTGTILNVDGGYAAM